MTSLRTSSSNSLLPLTGTVVELVLATATKLTLEQRKHTDEGTTARALAQLLSVLPYQHAPATLKLALVFSTTVAGMSESRPDHAPSNITMMDLGRFMSYVDTADEPLFGWYLAQLASLSAQLKHPSTFMDPVALSASRGGHVRILQHLVQAHPATRPLLLAHSQQALLNGASLGGHLAVFDFFVVQGQPIAPHCFNVQLAGYIGRGGHVHVAEWWHLQQTLGHVRPIDGSDERGAAIISGMVRPAYLQGNFVFIDWLFKTYHEQVGKQAFRPPDQLWLDASQTGGFEFLDWAADRGLPVPTNEEQEDAVDNPCLPLDAASEAGRLDVLQWWKRRVCSDMMHLYSHRAMEHASAAGRVDILNWWFKSSGLALAFTPHVIQVALDNGHFHVVQWWHKTCRPFTHVQFGGGQQDSGLMDKLIPKHPITLAAFGQLEWLDRYCPLDHRSTLHPFLVRETLAAAVCFGHIDILDEYIDRVQRFDLAIDYHVVPVFAAQHGQLAVMQWWFRNVCRDSKHYEKANHVEMRALVANGKTARTLRKCVEEATVRDHAHVVAWVLAHPWFQWQLRDASEEGVQRSAEVVKLARDRGSVKCVQVMLSVGMVAAE